VDIGTKTKFHKDIGSPILDRGVTTQSALFETWRLSGKIQAGLSDNHTEIKY